ncbi:MAG: hypothetical protein QM302_01540 [Acidobacteriota bacterium]|nr:hypothetical protein [Acidobacteriota bacterium]
MALPTLGDVAASWEAARERDAGRRNGPGTILPQRGPVASDSLVVAGR